MQFCGSRYAIRDQGRLVLVRVFGIREDWIPEWLIPSSSLPVTPRAPESTLVSNLLSPQNQVNSDWVQVWDQGMEGVEPGSQPGTLDPKP